MQKHTLGRTDIKVTSLCLGTMTWGKQNTQPEAFEQLDAAMDYGVNFIDTAEMYAVPAEAATYGATETILGNWFASSGQRDKFILATKVAGPGAPGWIGHIRGGQTRFSSKDIDAALENSLRRLQTDYIDLYQLHWPERNTNFFGKLGYRHRDDDCFTALHETLEALQKHIQAGKIRHIGVSNETPWGVMKFLAEAEARGLPRIESIQNPYSLLNRSYEVGLAEISYREQLSLLVYSPLAFGMLSGKYHNNTWPENARLTLFKQFSRYSNEQAIAATGKYLDLANKKGLDPAQMALAFVRQQGFVTSTIIGATSMAQLETDLQSTEVTLDAETMKAIEVIHTQHPNPAP
jgi:aryl-alcohol dehydrogenase-like predicted oxidoreductase